MIGYLRPGGRESALLHLCCTFASLWLFFSPEQEYPSPPQFPQPGTVLNTEAQHWVNSSSVLCVVAPLYSLKLDKWYESRFSEMIVALSSSGRGFTLGFSYLLWAGKRGHSWSYSTLSTRRNVFAKCVLKTVKKGLSNTLTIQRFPEINSMHPAVHKLPPVWKSRELCGFSHDFC